MRTTHGARSEAMVRRVSTFEKRAFLRARGLRLSDLDPIGVALLDAWARGQAKVVLMDEWFDLHGGFLDASGEPQPAAKVYFLAYNSTQRALAKFEQHLSAAKQTDPMAQVRAWLEGEAEEEA
jgi:hypothetical protein